MKTLTKLPFRAACTVSKKTVLFFLVILFSFPVTAQPTTDISGIVNTYHKVRDIVPAKSCVVVTDPTGLNVNTHVMLVQMKGASILTGNSSSFGDTTTLNSAGNYEIGVICYIIGDSVFLFHNLLNNYNYSSGQVQLVQFADYYSANVIGTIKPASWDSAAGTGGVIAIYANQDITLNAPIYADTSGYSGGIYVGSDGTCFNGFLAATGYRYDATLTAPQNGAYKGEGVVGNIAITQTGGRGAPANGGGGGNNHNNSGGGGANLTPGGIGGGNSSNTGCREPIQGLAGKALSSWNGTKIYLGGGAGAGHSNNGSPTTNFGGNGGGIVFLWANELIGNGKIISANGGKGGNSFGDGAGGGGAGGTIIMNIANYTGNVTIAANGGAGGDSYNDVSQVRCFGGGGGGSGGMIYFSGSVPVSATIEKTGGAAGLEPNRNPGCVPEVPAAAGIDGSFSANYSFSRSMDPAGYCALLLPVKLVDFSATLINKKVLLQWRIDNPVDIKDFIIERSINARNWTELITLHSLDQTNNYSTIDELPVPGNNFYRIRFIEKNNSLSYSPVKRITGGSVNEFVVFPNPAKTKITIAGNYSYPALVRIFDIAGKIMLQKTISSSPVELNLPALTPGIYILQVNQAIQKLVIR